MEKANNRWIKQVEGKKTSLQEFKELTKRYKNIPEDKDLDFLKSIFHKIPLFRVGFASRMNDSVRDDTESSRFYIEKAKWSFKVEFHDVCVFCFCIVMLSEF